MKGNSICWLQPAAQTVYALGLPDLRQPLSLQLSTQASLGKGKYRKEQLTALNFKIYHSSNHSPDYIQHYRKTRYEFQMVFWFSQKPKFGSNKIIKINKARKFLPCINGFLPFTQNTSLLSYLIFCAGSFWAVSLCKIICDMDENQGPRTPDHGFNHPEGLLDPLSTSPTKSTWILSKKSCAKFHTGWGSSVC